MLKRSTFWCAAGWFRDPGKGTLKDLGMYLSPKLHYWTVMWTVRSGQWDTPAMLQTMAASTLRTLPPPVDSVFYLIGDSMLKEQG